MKTIIDHVEYVRSKPHSVRRRVAFGVSTGVSALIALVWLASNLATNAFAIQGANFAMSTGEGATVATTSALGAPSGLAGAAAALDDENAPAHINVVDVTPPAVKKTPSDQTILPF